MDLGPDPDLSPHRTGDAQTAAISLRILATTDLHAHLLPWDDLAQVPAPGRGLAQVASLIRAARAEAHNCVLLDNGDFLNGSTLGDFLAEHQEALAGAANPMIAAMNLLGYDAATLGNHEFSHGVAHLQRALRDAAFPLVSANFLRKSPSGRQLAFLPPFTLLRRKLRDSAGNLSPITLGIIGFLPPQTIMWERRHLRDAYLATDIVQTARRVLPRMRRAGADLIIALSHSGFGTPDGPANAENVSALLAELPEIDVLIAGHTHQVFPETCGTTTNAAAAIAAIKPVIMPGFFGSHLGVIDLNLVTTPRGLRLAQHHCELRPVARRTPDGTHLHPTVTSSAEIVGLARDAAAALHRQGAEVLGITQTPLNSHFALLGHSAIQQLIAEAQRCHIRDAVRGTPWEALPILSAVAAFKAGGRGGPENYTDIPAGPLCLRNLYDLYIHPNSAVALCLTGAELRLWLERAVSLFHRIKAGQGDQPLVNPDYPAYNFDMIDGLTCRVDLTAPPWFDPSGRDLGQMAPRIHDLCHFGQPVQPTDQFVVASNSYRASGGSGFAGADPDHVIAETQVPLRQVLRHYVQTQGTVRPDAQSGWGFLPMPGTTVLLDSAANAAAHLPHDRLSPLGLTPTGFMRFRLAL